MLISLSTAQGAVSYSRNKNYYNVAPRYRSRLYTYSKVTQAADYIAGRGLAVHLKVPPGNRGWQSAITATTETRHQVMKIIDRGPKLSTVLPAETIILRDENGKPTEYKENSDIRRMRLRLAEMNNAIRSSILSGAVPDGLVRIFNRSFSRGGRFYALGGSWQSMSKIARQQIQINGEPVVEIDYATLHPALIYAQAGAPMPDDCYDIPGWPRPIVKQAFLVLINAKQEHRARAAIARHDCIAALARPGSSEAHAVASDLIAAIKTHHAKIAHAFHSDAGAQLMRIDSDLAEMVMHVMLMAGVVVLPVHDSFLVQESKAELLEKTMLRVAHEAGYESLRVARA